VPQPKALVEQQDYVFGAWMGITEAFDALGEGERAGDPACGTRSPSRRLEFGRMPAGTRAALGALIALLTLAVYQPVLGYGFVNFDDPAYVTDNPHVTAGLTLDGARWALTSLERSNWHPLTWLSHMLDCQLFSLDASFHHATSLALHAASAVLLFLFFAGTTGSTWRSAFVAALFALHPLHVESVAWVSERKDVLSTTLGILTLLAYAWYVQRPLARRLALVAGLFALGLMAKPMLVTLPLVMLLLDHWPLARPPQRTQWLEKLPLFALAAASAIVTYVAQSRGGAIVSLERIPLAVRVPNALVACATYLAHTVWPAQLTVFYPYRDAPGPTAIAASALALSAISIVAFVGAARTPAVVVGWLWYLVMLLPVLGLVQAGPQRMADRYSYLPLVGVFLMLAWGVPERLPRARHALAVVALIALVACSVATRHQLRYWSSSRALFAHAVAVEPDDALARVNLGHALLEGGDVRSAALHYLAAARLEPDLFPARFDAGVALLALGHPEAAVRELREAVRLQPASAPARVQLGLALEADGATTEAMSEYREALRLAPDDPRARERLAALGVAAR
jgi:tetratricopeptide (TPR) repeat protein